MLTAPQRLRHNWGTEVTGPDVALRDGGRAWRPLEESVLAEGLLPQRGCWGFCFSEMKLEPLRRYFFRKRIGVLSWVEKEREGREIYLSSLICGRKGFCGA